MIAFQAMFAWEVTHDEHTLLTFPWLQEEEEDAFYSSFSRLSEENRQECLSFASLLFISAVKHAEETDEIIGKYLKSGWHLSRISRVALAILRISVYCMLHQSDIDTKIVMNEAIEISKDYAEEGTYKFVNGILDNINNSLKNESAGGAN